MKLSFLALLAALVTPAFAFGAGVATPSECADTFEDCKENCTMEFGTSVTTRDKFGKCLGRCTRTSSECKERYFDITSNKLDPDALTRKRGKDPAAVERSERTRFDDEPRPRRGADAAPRPPGRYDPDDTPVRDDEEPPARPSRGDDEVTPRSPEPEPEPRSGPGRASGSSRGDDEPVRRTATRMSDLGNKPEPKRTTGEKLDPMLSSEPRTDPMLAPDSSAKKPEDPEPRARPAALDEPAPRVKPESKPARDEPAPAPSEPVDEPQPRRAADDWVPGDPVPQGDPGTPPAKKKDPEKAAPPPPEKGKAPGKKRALDEWDPDAF